VAGDVGPAHPPEGGTLGGAELCSERAAQPEGTAAGSGDGGRSRPDTK
jgi:hypothetical protein